VVVEDGDALATVRDMDGGKVEVEVEEVGIDLNKVFVVVNKLWTIGLIVAGDEGVMTPEIKQFKKPI